MNYYLRDNHLETGCHLQHNLITEQKMVEEKQHLLLEEDLKSKPVLR